MSRCLVGLSHIVHGKQGPVLSYANHVCLLLQSWPGFEAVDWAALWVQLFYGGH